MDVLPPNITRLIDEFSKLPSIGPKSAERLTFFLLKHGDIQAFSEAVAHLKDNIRRCDQCRNFTVNQTCPICSSSNRTTDQLAIVSQPLDIIAIEKTGQYNGIYHVLHGVISPVDGMGPENLEVESLMLRLGKKPPREVILALNPNIEGETTALYLAKKITPLGIRMTRLAHGLPMGGDLEYADQLTLTRALSNRQEV